MAELAQRVGRAKADTIVRNPQRYGVSLVLQFEVDLVGVRVANRIRGGLLRDPEQMMRGGPRQQCLSTGYSDGVGERARHRERDELAQRLAEVVALKQRR